MVKNSFLFGLLTLAVFLLAPTVMSAADAPAEVRAAAEKGFPYVKASIGKNPGQYGYEDASQAEQVTLGRAVRMRELDWDKVKTNNAKSLMALTKPTDSWRFFAEVAGKPTSIIDVEWLDGRVSRSCPGPSPWAPSLWGARGWFGAGRPSAEASSGIQIRAEGG
jgi:hypothetical protein